MSMRIHILERRKPRAMQQSPCIPARNTHLACVS